MRGEQTRRETVLALSSLALFLRPTCVCATERLSFGELYSEFSPSGFVLSNKAKRLDGQQIEFRGFMAPPLKADAEFLVLTKYPVSLCPFCNSDAEWPSDIVVVFLAARDTFVHSSAPVVVTGELQLGAHADPGSGMVSLVRIVNGRLTYS